MSQDKMDLSLDDLIKINKKTNRGGNNRRGGRGGGNKRNSTGGGVGQRRNNNRGGRGGRRSFGNGRSNNAPSGKWDHDMYKGGNGNSNNGRFSNGGGSSGKLTVRNLDFGVNDNDIRELFGEFGQLKKSAVHYDRTGRSLGTADVIFERRGDAAKALKQYNGVPLDGRAMQISFADGNQTAGNQGGLGSRLGKPNRGNNRNRGGGDRRGGNRGGQGRGNFRNRKEKEEISAEDLDKQLDDYVNQAKDE